MAPAPYDGGGGSSDELTYIGASTGVTTNLSTGTASGGESLVAGTFENLRGGPQNDNLTGDAGANLIAGAPAPTRSPASAETTFSRARRTTIDLRPRWNP